MAATTLGLVAMVASASASTLCLQLKPNGIVKGPETVGGTKCKVGYEAVELPSANELEILKHATYVPAGVGGKATVQFSGVNVQVVDGAGKTATVNGTGNLVVGYDEDNEGPLEEGVRQPAPKQTGSHNLVLGEEQEFTSYGGIVGGSHNVISGPFASVLGGCCNTASGGSGVVVAGFFNHATGADASVLGGSGGVASGSAAAVAGGADNHATTNDASVAGGELNEATAESAAVAGGRENSAGGHDAAVTGGLLNQAKGTYSSVTGGTGNKALSEGAVITGGSHNHIEKFGTIEPVYSVISGGKENDIFNGFGYDWIGGGFANSIFSSSPGTGKYDSLFGGDGLGVWGDFVALP
jgi:hypothetical protein